GARRAARLASLLLDEVAGGGRQEHALGVERGQRLGQRDRLLARRAALLDDHAVGALHLAQPAPADGLAGHLVAHADAELAGGRPQVLQNRLHSHRFYSTTRAGNLTVKMVPRPGVESMAMSPPCRSTILRTTDSPRPEPLPSVLVV